MRTICLLCACACAACCRAPRPCPSCPPQIPTPAITLHETEPCLELPPPAPLVAETREDGCPDWASVCLTEAGGKALERWERAARLWIATAWATCPHRAEVTP